jgi:effector-binding domain-containing protein
VTYDVRVAMVAACPTAVVAATTTWDEFPTLWGRLLDQVWALVRGTDLWTDGHNVMLYKDDVPNVEVGVQVTRAFEPSGRVVPSELPAGRVATTVHRGPYERLGDAHEAVVGWCAAQGLRLTRARWEIYGDPRPDPAETETEVSWLLA